MPLPFRRSELLKSQLVLRSHRLGNTHLNPIELLNLAHYFGLFFLSAEDLLSTLLNRCQFFLPRQCFTLLYQVFCDALLAEDVTRGANLRLRLAHLTQT